MTEPSTEDLRRFLRTGEQPVDHVAELSEEIDVVERAAGAFEDGSPDANAMNRVRLRLQHDRHLARQGEHVSTPGDLAAEARAFAAGLEDLLTARVRQAWLNYDALIGEVRRVRREEGNDSEDVADARVSRELARGMWLEAKRALATVGDAAREICPF